MFLNFYKKHKKRFSHLWSDGKLTWLTSRSVIPGNTRSYSVSMTMSFSRRWEHDFWCSVDNQPYSPSRLNHLWRSISSDNVSHRFLVVCTTAI